MLSGPLEHGRNLRCGTIGLSLEFGEKAHKRTRPLYLREICVAVCEVGVQLILLICGVLENLLSSGPALRP